MGINAQRTADGEDVRILHDSHSPTMPGKDRLDLPPGCSWTNRDRLIGGIVAHRIHMSQVQVQRIRAECLPSHAMPDALEGNFPVRRACISYGLNDLSDGSWRADFTYDAALEAAGVLKRNREGRRKS